MVQRYEREPEEAHLAPVIPIGENVGPDHNDQFADAFLKEAEALLPFMPQGTDIYVLAVVLRDVEGEKQDIVYDEVEAVEPHPEKKAFRRLIFKEPTEGEEHLRKLPIVVSVGALVVGAGLWRLRHKK